MVWIPGGEFTMGTDDPHFGRVERPAHRVRVGGFWMDATEITNAQFSLFAEATGYVTLAEKPVDWEELRKQLPPGTPKPADDSLLPGSLVFVQPCGPVMLGNPGAWWRWTPGACWRHPEGPASSIASRMNHPVVQIAWSDAAAYAAWAGKRLPTEVEWEFAARGGLEGKRFVWGDEEPTDTRIFANIWQGEFPVLNTLRDGFGGTSPVGTFAPNGYGLSDMAGNVWEWCADRFRADQYEREAVGAPGAVLTNPAGPADSWDPQQPVPTAEQRVVRGGSFLCNKSYCESYRTSARRGETPDSAASHIGFRCVIRGPSLPRPTPARSTGVRDSASGHEPSAQAEESCILRLRGGLVAGRRTPV
jgi:formylglycine-generating enzyme required for sulfatase activity